MYATPVNNGSMVPAQGYNGFVPPSYDAGMTFGKDSNGRAVVFANPGFDTQEALNQDMNELRQRINNHNWYYKYHSNLDVFSEGYRNEQAIQLIVQRRGGVFATIWETERARHLSRN